MNNFDNKKINELITILKQTYPDAKGSLDFSSPFELLVAVVLSAQCTDKRVNIVTKELFKKYNTPEEFASLSCKELESYINTCGLYKQKAKNLITASKILVSKFGGIVPTSYDDLMSLPGVGRKSANVIRLDCFDIATGIAVDTHVKRLSNLIGLSSKQTPDEIEEDLVKIIPKENLKDVNHLFIYHGRSICKARNPLCASCPISHLCNHFKNSF